MRFDQGRRTPWVMASLAILALLASMLICGCKKSQTELAAEQGAQTTAGAGRAGGRMGGMGRRGGRRGGMGGGMGAMGGGITAGGGGAAVEAPPAPAPVPAGPVVIPEAERVKKIRAFIAIYGPITIAHEKNWNGYMLEWAVFSHKGQSVKMPLSMIIDAPEPKELEGYFRIYPNVGGFNKGTRQWKITATSAVPPAPVQPGAKPKPPAAAAEPGAGAAAPTPRAGRGQRPADTGAQPQAGRAGRAARPAAGGQQPPGGARGGRGTEGRRGARRG